MKPHALETSVGVFVLLGLVCVAYLTIKLGKLEWFADDAYRVTARFASASGLKVGAAVDLAGVEVGRVESIVLDTREMVAVVRLSIRADVPLHRDVIASIRTSGLIGDKFVRLEPGGAGELLKDGDVITETESSVDIESMMAKYAFGKV